ncbi:MAG: transporter substrate-binding domain-containing protein [Alphaproteobacteria bacterium]
MKLVSLIFIGLLSALGAGATVSVLSAKDGVSPTSKESLYERITSTGTIRCGYTSWKPVFFIDPVTGEKKGIFHDLIEEAGKRLNLKIVWQEEVGWGSIIESIRSGRVDMVCGGYWLNTPRLRNLSATAPQLYTPLYVYGRQDETRSFKSLNDLNSDQLTVATIDGSGEAEIVAKRFAKTKRFTLTELNTEADEIQALLTNKVDFIVLDVASANVYMAANPGKIRSLLPDEPTVVFPNVMLMPQHEHQLKEVMDNILRNIEYDGTLDDTLARYGVGKSFLRNARPIVSSL